jgi:hypothetical protein
MHQQQRFAKVNLWARQSAMDFSRNILQRIRNLGSRIAIPELRRDKLIRALGINPGSGRRMKSKGLLGSETRPDSCSWQDAVPQRPAIAPTTKADFRLGKPVSLTITD